MNDHRSRDQNSVVGLLDSGYLQGVMGGAIGLLFTVLLQARGHLPGGIVVTVLGIAVGFFIMMGIARGVANVSAGAARSVYAPSGKTTAYVPTHSHIDALTIRGDLDGAAAAWDVVIAENPKSMGVLARAADFHLRDRKDPAVALEMFTRARTLGENAEAGTNIKDLQRYVQQKLVDLYLEGPTANEGRALVELRRLIEGFPGTREAEGARVSLAEIKARRAADEG